jgi:hypothetical protein
VRRLGEGLIPNLCSVEVLGHSPALARAKEFELEPPRRLARVGGSVRGYRDDRPGRDRPGNRAARRGHRLHHAREPTVTVPGGLAGRNSRSRSRTRCRAAQREAASRGPMSRCPGRPCSARRCPVAAATCLRCFVHPKRTKSPPPAYQAPGRPRSSTRTRTSRPLVATGLPISRPAIWLRGCDERRLCPGRAQSIAVLSPTRR